MATCPTCGNTVALGGYKDGKRKYCSKRCYTADEISRVAETIPAAIVEQMAKEIHGGICPKCSKSGPVDVHKSYSVYSIIIYTKWQTNEHVLCKKCASKQQTTDLIGSFLLGWWGIPFGLIITPIQIARNIFAMSKNPDSKRASDDLKRRARLILAAKEMAKRPGQSTRKT